MRELDGRPWTGNAHSAGNTVALGNSRYFGKCGHSGTWWSESWWFVSIFFLNIPSGAVLSLWCHSLSALQLFGGCDLSPLPHHHLCVTAQINSFHMSWGHLSEPWHPREPPATSPVCFCHTLLFWVEKGVWGMDRTQDPSSEQRELVTPPCRSQSWWSPVCGFPDLPWECTVDSCSNCPPVLPSRLIHHFPGCPADQGYPALPWSSLRGSCWSLLRFPIPMPAASSSLVLPTNIMKLHLHCPPRSTGRCWTTPGHCLALGYSDCHLKLIKLQSNCTHCPSLGMVHCHSL